MTSAFNVRIEKEIKDKAEELFNTLGITLSAAINAFLRASIRSKGLPFDLNLEPNFNKRTINSMTEAKAIANDPNVKGYKTIKALKKALED